MSTACVVVAGGRGERLGLGVPKGLVALGGASMLEHAVAAVRASAVVDVVVAVVPAAEVERVRLGEDVVVTAGGVNRQASVRAGLAVLGPDVDVVLVHDAARALTPPDQVADVVAAVRAGHDVVVPGVPLVDTVRAVDGPAVDRASLVAVQTPQGFTRALLDRAHTEQAGESVATDDAGMVERLGVRVHVVPGHTEAFKVTTALDLVLAEAVLARRAVTR